LTSGVNSVRFQVILANDGLTEIRGVEVLLGNGNLNDTVYLEESYLDDFRTELDFLYSRLKNGTDDGCSETRFPNELDKTAPGNVVNVINVGCGYKDGKLGVNIVFPRSGRFFFSNSTIDDVTNIFARARNMLDKAPYR
jgi:hypothetical protein